jgi:hypothetical protein
LLFPLVLRPLRIGPKCRCSETSPSLLSEGVSESGKRGRTQAVLALRIGTWKRNLNHGCYTEIRIAHVFTHDSPLVPSTP